VRRQQGHAVTDRKRYQQPFHQYHMEDSRCSAGAVYGPAGSERESRCRHLTGRSGGPGAGQR